MDVRILKIAENQPETVEIRCHGISEQVQEIAAFVKSRQGNLTGFFENRQYEVPFTDIYYIEAVDNRLFLYSSRRVYETRHRLYELEEMLRKKNFLRVSKSILLNLLKVQAIRPAAGGRFTAILKNGEEVVISRKYVPELKKALKGGVSL